MHPESSPQADQPTAPGFDLVTLLTDYGASGGFVGALHAVVDSITAAARPGRPVRIIDLDHSVPRHDVMLGALRLERMTRYSRPGVHVGVVDPGVGTGRRRIAVQGGGRAFVGPDNGLLAFAAEATGATERCVVLDDERYFLASPSATFDGRDVFAPVAAHLAAGADLYDLGEPVEATSLVRLERPSARRLEDGSLDCEVVQVDGFGNVQLGAAGELVAELGPRVVVAPVDGTRALEVPVGATFADVELGGALLLVDSDGCLAISVNGGRADELLGVGRARRVVVRSLGR